MPSPCFAAHRDLNPSSFYGQLLDFSVFWPPQGTRAQQSHIRDMHPSTSLLDF